MFGTGLNALIDLFPLVYERDCSVDHSAAHTDLYCHPNLSLVS